MEQPRDERVGPSPEDPAALVRTASAVAGPCAAVGVAGALVAARDLLGVANVAIVMVIVVLVAAAIGGRLAGLLTAGVGALAFNFFHTQPFLSFAVAAREDVVSVVLLALVGGAVGEAGFRAGELSRQHRAVSEAQRSFDVLLSATARGDRIEDIWDDVWLVLSRHGCSKVVFVRAGPDGVVDAPLADGETYVVPVATGVRTIGHLYATTADRSTLDRPTGELIKRVAEVFALALASGTAVPERLE